jgi:D-threo-aldose 1-dehydrogenase
LRTTGAAFALPRIGFGTSGIGNLTRRLSEAEATAVIEQALASGITFFDTAPLYGYGLSELRLGRSLRQLPRASFILSTKVGRYFEPTWGRPLNSAGWHAPLNRQPVLAYTRDGVMRSLEQSFARLGIDSIDIVFIHDLDRRNLGEAYDATYAVALDGAYRALDDLRSSGQLRAIGVGVNEVEPALSFIRDADLDVVMLAGRLSILDHMNGLEFLGAARERNVAIIAAAIFNSGLLVNPTSSSATYDYQTTPAPVRARAEQLGRIAATFDVPVQALALQFPFRLPGVKSIVLGMSTCEHVAHNLTWLNVPLPPELWIELERKGFLAHFPIT